MKRIVVSSAVLGLALGTVGFASADTPGDTDTTKTAKDVTTFDCGDGDTVVFGGPDTLWPPNHKLVAQLATATEGEDADPTDQVTLTIMPSVVDALGGDGNTEIDYDFPEGLSDSDVQTTDVPFSVRAERSGKGEGRTYTFAWSASFDGAVAGTPTTKTCSSSDPGQSPYVVFVPHDQGKGNDAR